MQLWRYAYAGLRVVSELQIPEWDLFKRVDSVFKPDVCIAFDSAAVHRATLPAPTANEYHFQIADVADYRVRDGREIIVSPAPGADLREVRVFLLGTAWGALCYQRGILVLHASVVQVGEQAVAFCGATGSGKSSVAAWLVARGCSLVGDDLCRFDVAGGQARVYPAAPRLRLWQEALGALGWSGDGLEREQSRWDKFQVSIAPNALPEPLPLRAVYLLGWGDENIMRLTGQTALHCFVSAATYRGKLLAAMGIIGPYWQQCLELARCVPVFQFTRRRDWSAMEAAMDLLMARLGPM